jgi:outer membrane protein assembly factor BamA
VTNLSDTNGSAGVEAMDGTGNEYFYNLQLTGSNLIKAGDIAILGVRYANADTTRTTSLSLNTRYPFSQKLRVNPRLRVDYRNNTTDDTDQFIYRPSLRLTYRAKGRLQLEAEAGGEWSDREIVDGSEKDRSYFAIIGYRMDF